MAIVTLATIEEMTAAFNDYALALGKVAHAWNYIFERLGAIFVIVAGGDRWIAEGIWHAPDSDRTKLSMLRSSIELSSDDRWPHLPTAKADLLWLVERVNNLSDLRNNVIHAPCTMSSHEDGASMVASPLSGHQRAKKLWGREILVEFDWCERWTESLARFTSKAETALMSSNGPWPDRPGKPDRKTRKSLTIPQPPA